MHNTSSSSYQSICLIKVNVNTCVCVSGDKKCLFFGNFGVLCFLETPVLRFAILRYYRRKLILFTGLSCHDPIEIYRFDASRCW